MEVFFDIFFKIITVFFMGSSLMWCRSQQKVSDALDEIMKIQDKRIDNLSDMCASLNRQINYLTKIKDYSDIE